MIRPFTWTRSFLESLIIVFFLMNIIIVQFWFAVLFFTKTVIKLFTSKIPVEFQSFRIVAVNIFRSEKFLGFAWASGGNLLCTIIMLNCPIQNVEYIRNIFLSPIQKKKSKTSEKTSETGLYLNIMLIFDEFIIPPFIVLGRLLHNQRSLLPGRKSYTFKNRKPTVLTPSCRKIAGAR